MKNNRTNQGPVIAGTRHNHERCHLTELPMREKIIIIVFLIITTVLFGKDKSKKLKYHEKNQHQLF